MDTQVTQLPAPSLMQVQKLIIVRLVAHSSHINKLLDLCVFGVFKMLYKREQHEENEKRNTKDVSHDSGTLQSDDYSNNEMEFPRGRISPHSERSLDRTD
jgi:hypothetical protein